MLARSRRCFVMERTPLPDAVSLEVGGTLTIWFEIVALSGRQVCLR